MEIRSRRHDVRSSYNTTEFSCYTLFLAVAANLFFSVREIVPSIYIYFLYFFFIFIFFFIIRNFELIFSLQ